MMRPKRLACLGLAASMALPQGLLRFSRLFADEPAGSSPASGNSQAKLSNGDLLKQGIDEYNQGQYEEAVATLQEVDAKALNNDDHETLVSILSKAGDAATERRSARMELAEGDEARRSDRMIEAEGHYQAVLSNARADDATRTKAREQLAVVEAARKNATGEAKAAYDRGVDEYKQGLWKQARADFNAARDFGYSGGLLEASPADYLAKMDDKEKQYMAGARAAEGRQAYNRGREEYRSGDWADARTDFAKARDLGFVPGFMEGLSPSEYLTRMDEKDAADKQAMQSPAPASVGQPVAYADAATSTPAPSTPAPSNAGNGESGSSQDQQDLQHRAELDRIAEQQRIYKAAGLVDMGKKSEASGNDQDALNDYTQAVELDPTNAQAVQGRDRLLAKSGRGPGTEGATLPRTEEAISREISAVNYKFSAALDAARKATGGNDFASAENDIADAQAARDEDPTIFNDADLQRMDTRLAQARSFLARAKESYERGEQMTEARQASVEQQALIERQRRQRESTVAALIKESRTQIDEQNYAGALGVLDQILTLDPQNDYATGIRQFVEDKAVLQEQAKYRRQMDYNFSKMLNHADEAQIPYEDIYRYPENWPDISEMRDNEAKDINISKEDQEVQAQLDHRLPKVELSSVSLTDAIDFLRELTGANILVNWKALEAAGIDKDTQVTATLHDVKFSKVLDIILKQAGPDKLAYTIDEGVITISTTDELNKAVVTRVYDITDLLINPNFDPTLTNAGQAAQSAGSSSGGQGGGNAFGTTTGTTTKTNTTAQQVQLIEKKIENTVEFSSWKDNDPNGYGTIDDFNSELIITQTSEVHNKIVNLLSQLREAQAVQVSVEARFLTIQRDYLESVGVNLGMTFNSQSASNPNSQWSPITVTNGSSAFTASPTTGVPGGIIGATGLGVGASYGGILNDFQVSLIVQAVEASSRSSVVHAPTVTLQNGQGAQMEEVTEIPYVGSLTASVASGAAIATPDILNAPDGVEFIIGGVWVSADRKYVTMDLDPYLYNNLGFTTFQYETAAPATGTGIIGTGGFTAPTLTIQEPTTEITEVHTRVKVPDGGTLLLGGETIAGEQHLEAGVPGLSKIPFLKVLTTNESEANDEQVLLILVKPTIIINKEIEAKNFPLLSSNNNR